MSRPVGPRKIRWDQIRVPNEFAEWIREEAAREGRFIHALLASLVAKALDGERPWEKGGKKK